jgi:hypothetical protein
MQTPVYGHMSTDADWILSRREGGAKPECFTNLRSISIGLFLLVSEGYLRPKNNLKISLIPGILPFNPFRAFLYIFISYVN